MFLPRRALSCLAAVLLLTLLALPAAFAQRATSPTVSVERGGSGPVNARLVETSTGPYAVNDTYEVKLQLSAGQSGRDLGTSTIVIDFNEFALSFPESPTEGAAGDYEYLDYDGFESTINGGNAIYNSEVRRASSGVRVVVFIDLGGTDDAEGKGKELPQTLTDVVLIRFTVADPEEGLALAFRSQQVFDGPGGPSGAYSTGEFTGLARAQQSITGAAGWRMLSAPAENLTVADLADQNLVQGVSGQYPAGDDNVYLDYTGAAFTPAASSTDALDVGEGFIWYHFDGTFDPSLPTGTSTSVALPYALSYAGPPAAGLHPGAGLEIAASEISVPLQAVGDNWNLVGNPLPYSFDLDQMTAPSGSFQTTVEIWDASAGSGAGSYILSTDPAVDGVVAPWQGFFLQNVDAPSLSFDIAGQTSGGDLLRPDRSLEGPVAVHTSAQGIGFTLVGDDPENDLLTYDQAIQLYLSDEADTGWDRLDAEKLTPLKGTHATLAFVGERDGAEVLMAQDARPAETDEGYILPLAFEAVGIDGTFTVAWPRLDVPESWPLTLVDLVEGTEIDLRETSSYSFDASAGRPAEAEPVAFEAAPMQRLGDARFVLYAGTAVTTSTEEGSALPAAFALEGNYPNPFNSGAGTRVRYALPEASSVTVAVYDVLGRRVAVLAQDEEKAAGYHEVPFRASGLASGIYLVTMEAAGQRFVHKMTLVQ